MFFFTGFHPALKTFNPYGVKVLWYIKANQISLLSKLLVSRVNQEIDWHYSNVTVAFHQAFYQRF
jgi:hypothetical protein